MPTGATVDRTGSHAEGKAATVVFLPYVKYLHPSQDAMDTALENCVIEERGQKDTLGNFLGLTRPISAVFCLSTGSARRTGQWAKNL